MRIVKLILDKSITEEKGINEIDLSKKDLGPVVALVGKNGAGKSRILKRQSDEGRPSGYVRALEVGDCKCERNMYGK